MKRKKCSKFLLLFLLCAGVLFNCTSIDSSAASVNIIVEHSAVAHMYYQVVKNGESISAELKYTILDADGNIVFEGETEDKVILTEKLPFGDYKIIVHAEKDYIYEITLDSTYLESQHELKMLELKDKKNVHNTIAKTGDDADLGFYFTLLMIAGVLIVMVIHKSRKKERREEDEV